MPRPHVFSKGGHDAVCAKYFRDREQHKIALQTFVVPTLRTEREERGPQHVGDASEIRSLGDPSALNSQHGVAIP